MRSGFVYAFSHYLFPSHSNNQKAKLLHGSSIAFLTLILFAYHFVLQSSLVVNIGILGYAANISPTKVIELTNQKRVEAGLSALSTNDLLTQAARAKAEDMLADDYWAHVAPDGTEPWKFFSDAGYVYRYAGENLARDFSSPELAIEAWMASPSHRDNLLSSKYQEIGIAVIEGDLGGVDTTLIVQLFGTPTSATSESLPVAQAAAQEVAAIPTPTFVPTPTLIPTPTLTLVAEGVKNSPPTEIAPSLNEADYGVSSSVSPFEATKKASVSIVSILLGVLVIDGIVTTRRNSVRVGGRTFAHMAFFGMIMAILLVARAGQIL